MRVSAQTETELRDRSLWARVRSTLRGLRGEEIHDGSWFLQVLRQRMQEHNTAAAKVDWAAVYPGLDVDARAQRHIRRVARRAAAAGAVTSVGASAGELVSLFTEGLAAPIGIPAALLSVVADATYRTLAQLDLASDLASMYGVPFANDPDDIAMLFAVTAGAGAKQKDAAAGSSSGAGTQFADLEDGAAAKHLGKRILQESILRSIVPVVGIAISARWNYVATFDFAAQVQRYLRHRIALATACAKLRLDDVEDPEIFAQGAWLLASCDGHPTREERMAIACVLEHFPEVAARLPAFGIDDEEEWFERLAKVTAKTDGRLVDLLTLVAATEKDLVVAERRFLTRVGKTLGHKVDFDRIERLCTHLREGDSLPEGFFAATNDSRVDALAS